MDARRLGQLPPGKQGPRHGRRPPVHLVMTGFILATLSAAATTVQAAELAVPGPVLAPIRYAKWFEGERELYGYDPAFVPDAVTFDEHNRPYMRADRDLAGREDVIQTLDEEGQWISLAFGAAIRQAYPEWDGNLLRGVGSERRVVFDDDGDAYMMVDARGSNIDRVLLLHSRDRCRSWETYVVPSYFARLEFQAGHNDLSRPPVIAARGGRTHLFLFTPEKQADGSLVVGDPVQVAVSCVGGGLPAHSGASNVVATRGEMTHVVFATRYEVDGQVGTPQWAVGLNWRTREVSGPLLLGAAGIEVDNHNWPAVVMDSTGYLHVVLGAHGGRKGQHFKYTRSVEPNSSAAFAETTPMRSGYTYPALVCDAADTLHLVARTHGLPYRLVYLSKASGRPWSEHQELIVPYSEEAAFYSIWYHKLNIDRKGRLFVSYQHYARPSSREQAEAYLAKWPDDEITVNADGSLDWKRLTPHNPGMLLSDDGGRSWRLALTADFVAGVIR